MEIKFNLNTQDQLFFSADIIFKHALRRYVNFYEGEERSLFQFNWDWDALTIAICSLHAITSGISDE